MITWYPDFCPSGQCVIELDKASQAINWLIPKRIVKLCPHHKNLGLSDQGVFEAILQSSRVKEAAKAAAKKELGLDEEHPGVPFKVNADGSFTILTDPEALEWEASEGIPGTVPAIDIVTRNRARAAALAAAAQVHRVNGVSAVTVD